MKGSRLSGPASKALLRKRVLLLLQQQFAQRSILLAAKNADQPANLHAQLCEAAAAAAAKGVMGSYRLVALTATTTTTAAAPATTDPWQPSKFEIGSTQSHRRRSIDSLVLARLSARVRVRQTTWAFCWRCCRCRCITCWLTAAIKAPENRLWQVSAVERSY